MPVFAENTEIEVVLLTRLPRLGHADEDHFAGQVDFARTRERAVVRHGLNRTRRPIEIQIPAVRARVQIQQAPGARDWSRPPDRSRASSATAAARNALSLLQRPANRTHQELEVPLLVHGGARLRPRARRAGSSAFEQAHELLVVRQ